MGPIFGPKKGPLLGTKIGSISGPIFGQQKLILEQKTCKFRALLSGPNVCPPGFLALLRRYFCVTRVGSFLCSESSLHHTNYLRFKSSCAVPAVSKVASYLQWAKCCRGNLRGKKPLFINMDDTSFTFHYGKQKGLVVFFVSPKTRTVAVNMFFTCRTCSLCHLIHIDSTCCQAELQRKTYHLQLTPYFGPQFWHPIRDHVFRF